LSDISKTIRNKGFVSFYCQVSNTGSVGMKILTFLKFDEKRAITSRWVIRFTLKLQAR
jgi:hypothetical protein